MIVFTVAAVAASAALAGCATSGTSSTSAGDSAPSAAGASTTPIATDSVTLVVYGMSCPLCANNVDGALLAVDGVSAVNVDMSTGITVVELDGSAPVSRQQLATAVDRSGFSLQRIEP